MGHSSCYHYTECGLKNIYLVNGFKIIETPRGNAVSIIDVEGLHKAIGKLLANSKRDLSGDELRFLRIELLMSQDALSKLLGVTEQQIRRWETGKHKISKTTESLLRLLYLEHIDNHEGKIAKMLRRISALEDWAADEQVKFEETADGWRAAA